MKPRVSHYIAVSLTQPLALREPIHPSHVLSPPPYNYGRQSSGCLYKKDILLKFLRNNPPHFLLCSLEIFSHKFLRFNKISY